MWGKPKLGQIYQDSNGMVWVVDEIKDKEICLKSPDNRMCTITQKQLSNFKKVWN